MSATASTPQLRPGGPGTEDSDLVRRVRRGDDRAFEQLYHRYHRRITAYIQGMVHDHARAEDIAQDVFVSALRRMRDTDRPIAFKPWIYEIAKNACIDQFRRSRRSEEVSYDAEEGMGGADYGRLVSADAAPESRLESKQSLENLRGAFGGLSEAHHQILVMRELEGLSYREIGERLGMSRPSVESTLFRARRRLTEEYEELVSGARCQRIQAIIAGAETADLGARDERRLARHVSHCQPCRRQARLAGLDIAVTADRPVRARIAALVPLPLFLRKRWAHADVSSLDTSHVSGFTQWSAQLGSTVDPSWIKAAATAATVAVAGVGAGVAGHAATPLAPAGSLSAIVSGIGATHAAPGAPPALRARVRTPTGMPTTTAVAVTTATTIATTTAPAVAPAPETATSTTPTTATTPADHDGIGLDRIASGLGQGTGDNGGGGAGSGGGSATGGGGSGSSSSNGSHAAAPAIAAPDPATAVQGTNDAANQAVGTVTTAVDGLTGGG